MSEKCSTIFDSQLAGATERVERGNRTAANDRFATNRASVTNANSGENFSKCRTEKKKKKGKRKWNDGGERLGKRREFELKFKAAVEGTESCSTERKQIRSRDVRAWAVEAAEPGDNAIVPRRTNRNSFSRHWEHGKLANDSTIRPYSPILAPGCPGQLFIRACRAWLAYDMNNRVVEFCLSRFYNIIRALCPTN